MSDVWIKKQVRIFYKHYVHTCIRKIFINLFFGKRVKKKIKEKDLISYIALGIFVLFALVWHMTLRNSYDSPQCCYSWKLNKIYRGREKKVVGKREIYRNKKYKFLMCLLTSLKGKTCRNEIAESIWILFYMSWKSNMERMC